MLLRRDGREDGYSLNCVRRILSLAGLVGILTASAADRDWPEYLGDKARSHYSSLAQINTRNVPRLQVAWMYHSSDARGDNQSQIQCNPLIIDGVLYGTTPQLKLVALDAATGHERWRFDPFASAKGGVVGVNRGVTFWADGQDRRIIFSADHFLYEVNADTGRLVPGFGTNGQVDIKVGLGWDVSRLYVVSTTPGAIFHNLYFLPMRLGEGPAPAAPGHIRAYDVLTGKIVWTFHTIPYPGEFGAETWPPDAWSHIGAANCWAGMSLDERRGVVYVPTGSAAFDFWGGNRIGQDLFANCLLALDANTGRRLWHFQFVHHDLWDRDLPAPPNLLTVKHGGRRIDAVAQITKSGHVFLFNRDTGEPLFPIEERQVPRSDLPGESTWPTQPVPLKPAPFARQLFTYDEITDISPEAHRAVLERFERVRPHVPFAPPSMEGTIIFPGYDGGGEWGGAATDPDGVLYVNANEMAWILKMVEARAGAEGVTGSGQQLFVQICAACHGLERKGNAAQNVPTLVDISKKMSRDDFQRLLQTGRGMMPSFGFLSEPQQKSIADFVLDNKPQQEAANRQGDVPAVDVLGGIPYSFTGYNRWFDTNGYPAVKPPWGTLNAIDLNTGEFRWRVPLGEDAALTARGIPPTGLENYGGPLVTAGGLLFIGASKDEMFRAFDRRTGKILWQTQLPAGGYATPATYQVNGRQYVVIACGGGKMGTKSGDAYVAFALPDHPARAKTHSAAELLATRTNYPAQWWVAVPTNGAPAWEIFPQEAAPGEVILSKRNELGLLSNFAATPFTFHGKRYASLEGFWQIMKYPETDDDPRVRATGVQWAYTREQVAQMTAFEAKRAGDLGSENMRRMGITWVSFEGKQMEYRPKKPGEHYRLIVAATHEKVRQNPEVRKVLLATGDLILKPDHYQEANAPAAWRYFEILTQIRAELQKP